MEVLHGNWPTWRGSENSLTSTLASVLVEHELLDPTSASTHTWYLGSGYNNLRWDGPSFDPSLPDDIGGRSEGTASYQRRRDCVTRSFSKNSELVFSGLQAVPHRYKGLRYGTVLWWLCLLRL